MGPARQILSHNWTVCELISLVTPILPHAHAQVWICVRNAKLIRPFTANERNVQIGIRH